MAAELQPPDAPIDSAIVNSVGPAGTPAVEPPPPHPTPPTTVAPTVTTTAAQPFNDIAGPSLAPKRQRRPSVRLGEIGDQPCYDSHSRRPIKPPWRFSKDPPLAPSSKTIKARSLTNLVNGASNSYDNHEFEERNNQNGDRIADSGNRRVKAKRGRRVRSNWGAKVDDGAEGDIKEDGDKYYRDFDPDSDSPLKDHSPVHSVDNVALDSWHRRPRNRISESRENGAIELELPESDSRDRKFEGVRSWLIELGLSRYTPMFEIHEVDDEVLPMLTLEDLKDMGINAVGSRRKIHTAIQKLRKGFS